MPEIMQAGGQTQWVDLGASVNSTLSLSHLPSCGSCAQHLEMEVSVFKYQMSAGMIIFFFLHCFNFIFRSGNELGNEHLQSPPF